MISTRRWQWFSGPLMVLFALSALAAAMNVSWARAQGEGDPPHPAHIHTGTCDNLGDIVAPLDDVALRTAGESFGAASAIPVTESETEVPLALGDILGAPHAVNIHESADAIQRYIACGDIGGRVVDGKLTIGLRELNGSGHSGVAVLEDDDDQTGVTVYLAEAGAPAGGEEAAADTAETPAAAAETPAPAETPAASETPAAETPAAAAPATEEPAAAVAAEVPVDIRDFLFAPDPVQVPVGGTVTWTNQGAVPHTATATERDVLKSGAISPGASFSQVFPTAGEFSYFCEFHPNMTGTIVVE